MWWGNVGRMLCSELGCCGSSVFIVDRLYLLWSKSVYSMSLCIVNSNLCMVGGSVGCMVCLCHEEGLCIVGFTCALLGIILGFVGYDFGV